jgi:hypothetical protein
VVQHVHQQAAHLKTPPEAAEADLKALAQWPLGSAIKDVRIVNAPWPEQRLAAVKFHHDIAGRPRFISLGLWSACLLAIGAGVPVYLKGNETRGGYLYPALKPYSVQFYLPRLLKNPAPGQRVRASTADGIPTNHHYIANRTLRVEGADQSGEMDRAEKSPGVTRERFLDEAERHYAQHREEIGFDTSVQDYMAALRLAFELADAEA